METNMLINIVGPYSLETNMLMKIWVSRGLVSETKCPQAPNSTHGVFRAKRVTFGEKLRPEIDGFGVNLCFGFGGMPGGGSFDADTLIKVMAPYSLDSSMFIKILGFYSLEDNMLLKIMGPYSSETNRLMKIVGAYSLEANLLIKIVSPIVWRRR